MKKINSGTIATYITICAMGLALLQSGCSSDDVAQAIADEFVAISGKISNLSDTGEPDVEVEGVYSNPGDALNPTKTTDVSGNFSLQVLKNSAVYLRATKSSFATINSAKAPLNASVTGLDIGMPTVVQAQSMIDTAFDASTPPLQNHAWLVVDVVDPVGEGVSGQTITSSITPTEFVYTECNGTDVGATATTGPCPTGRTSPMYLAYFDAASEASITVGGETQTAPIRMGEITALEYEVASAPVGTFADGKAKYDADCASCHKAGTYDPTGSAADLYDKGELLITNISAYAPGQKAGVVDNLTPQEILDLDAFLEDPSIQ